MYEEKDGILTSVTVMKTVAVPSMDNGASIPLSDIVLEDGQSLAVFLMDKDNADRAIFSKYVMGGVTQ